MTRELRTLVISILTVFVLAGYNFLLYGVFFFTIPINDFLLLIVAGYYTWYHFRSAPIIWLLVLLFSVLQLLGQTHNLEVLIPVEKLTAYAQTDIPYYCTWLSWAAFAVVFTLYYKQIKVAQRLIRMLVLYVPLALALLLDQYLLVLLSPLLLMVDMALDKNREENGFNPLFYWVILLLLLQGTTALYVQY